MLICYQMYNLIMLYLKLFTLSSPVYEYLSAFPPKIVEHILQDFQVVPMVAWMRNLPYMSSSCDSFTEKTKICSHASLHQFAISINIHFGIS